MNTCQVISYLLDYLKINDEACEYVFVGTTASGDKYDIYMDDCSKDIFIDEFDGKGWVYKSKLSDSEFNVILKIDNWR